MRMIGPMSRSGLTAALIALLIDQVHKWWMIEELHFAAGQSRIEVASFFDIILTWNRGISYGLFKQDGALGQWGLTAFAVLIVIALGVWLAQLKDRLSAVSVGLIMGGALGNAIDRIRFGAVADFFHFHLGSFSWYIFNIADVSIVFGVAGLLYESLFASHKKAGNEI
jgi:signal peptidase II